MKNTLAIASVALLLAACSTETKHEASTRMQESTPASTRPGQSMPEARTLSGTVQQRAGNPHQDPHNILSKRSVYFDFDQFFIADEARPVVSAHAKHLASNPAKRVTIQGNADERGSREYNLALGQKRADAVKQMMVLSGARPQAIETISAGEEKPRAPGHDEAAWAENRRADIVYSGE